MLLNGAPPPSPSPVYEDFFYLIHHGLMKIVTGEWKLFGRMFGKKKLLKMGGTPPTPPPPPFVKMVAILRDKITTTAIRLCLQDIWIHRLQQYFKNFPSAFRFAPRSTYRLEPLTPPPPPPAPFLCGYDQCLGSCTASYLFLFQFRNDIISMR